MSVENVRVLLYVFAGIAVILFLVAIIMSHKSWKVHTLIMVFLVFCAASTTFWFAAQTLKVQKSWRQILHGPQLEKPPPGHPQEGLIAATEKYELENRELELGKEKADGQIEVDGIVQLRIQLAKTLYARGRVWTNCEPSAMAPGAPSVTVKVSDPKPSRIKPNLILYVFESRPFTTGGKYLGMFRVTEATGGGEEGGASDDQPEEGAEGGEKKK